jgi:hypothetical protein
MPVATSSLAFAVKTRMQVLDIPEHRYKMAILISRDGMASSGAAQGGISI